jgi:hypothetical protein
MNVVVNFLSMLGHEAETGGVHRMLGVCSEFERIAKVVIEKSEKDHASRRKRKNQDQSSNKLAPQSTTKGDSPSFNPNPIPPTSRPTTASSATPQASGSHAAHHNQRHLSPQITDRRSPQINDRRSPQNANSYSPMTGTMSQSPSPGLAPTGWHNDITPDSSDYNAYADMAALDAMGVMNAAGMGPGAGLGSPPAAGAAGFFQQPMLPQDLFSLPMTLDWNWAEMSGGAYPSVENGNFGAMDVSGGGGGGQSQGGGDTQGSQMMG